jgi:hypothetical protein
LITTAVNITDFTAVEFRRRIESKVGFVERFGHVG